MTPRRVITPPPRTDYGLVARRDRELAEARRRAGVARRQWERAEHALRNIERYWAEHPPVTP